MAALPSAARCSRNEPISGANGPASSALRHRGAVAGHYGFDSFFCIPGKEGAHEKGGVEGEIGRFRRRHLVPVPAVASLAALNQRIAAAGILDDGRVITGRPVTVAAAFAAE